MIDDVDVRAELWGACIRYVMDQDRAWFDAHPGAEQYYRVPFEGEWGPNALIEPGAKVLVKKLSPDVRARIPLDGIALNVTADPYVAASLMEGKCVRAHPKQKTFWTRTDAGEREAREILRRHLDSDDPTA